MTAERPMRLLISCPDQHGIVAAVSGFLYERWANIVEADQHATEPEARRSSPPSTTIDRTSRRSA